MLAIVLVTLPAGCRRKSPAAGRKVLVLGFDGMDPKLVRRLLDAGRMPNFARLERQGGFRPLTTSIPPQSPVAWSNFITGAGPGVHGIFDFIHRDPKQQAMPYFSTSIDKPGDEPWLTVPVGQYRFSSAELNPWADRGTTELARRGTPFWDYLDEHGIPVRMYRLPANYPPSESKHGHVCCLSGMGVPDALATQGTFQHLSTRVINEKNPGGGLWVPLRKNFKTGAYVARLEGPANEYLEPPKGGKSPPGMIVEINVYPDPENDVAKIRYVNEAVAGNQTIELLLDVGEWSDWHTVRFLKTPVGPSLDVKVRLYLQQIRPDIELYVTPLNFDPLAPAARISEPADFVTRIGEAIGTFYTQGFAEDFKAREADVFTDAEYQAQADEVLRERFRMLDHALDEFEEGLLFFYVSSSDLQAHIFWWDSDEPHPVRSPEDARKYNAVVEDLYVRMDEALGRCMKRLGDEATIIVMSDHGFCNFRRQFSLNTWLRAEGYLEAETHLLLDTDWSVTRAYGLGLNGLYLNLRGREKYGIVLPAERDALLDEISERLLAVRDPDNDKPVIRRVYRTDRVYAGPEVVNAPDLIVGYERGYRASWRTGLGEFDEDFVIDNVNAWSADHCIAHDVVPGILLCNKPIRASEPALIDVAPTILSAFGIPTPDAMTGRDFLSGEVKSLASR